MPYASHHTIRIRYEVVGDGPPLVLHHGTGDCLESWEAYGYTSALQHHYRLILIDARGHGASDKPRDPAAYSLEQRAADVVAVLDRLGIPRTHYLGLSLGGWAGLGLAKYAHHRLRSLIIGGAHPYGQSMQIYRQLFAAGLTTWLSTLEQMAGASLPAEHRSRLLNNNDLHALRASVANDRPEIADILPHVQLPCLLIAGDTDPLYPLVQRCATELANASFCGLPGLNHVQSILRSDILLPHVRTFLSARPGEPVEAANTPQQHHHQAARGAGG